MKIQKPDKNIPKIFKKGVAIFFLWVYSYTIKSKGATEMKKNIKKSDINRLEKELKNTTDSKRRTFLMATINRYSTLLGLNRPYPEY